MMKILCSFLLRPKSNIIHNNHLAFPRTMFIRSIDKLKTKDWSQQQPYNKFFILDFEATCDNKAHLIKPQEIIEFPCVLVEFSNVSQSFEVLSYFHSYVKPMIHTELTEYCSQLTGITQDMVCNSPLFDEVFQNFCKWYINQANDEDKSIIVTSGNWDLGNIFIEQCKLFPSTVQIPEFMCTWINIKKVFALTIGQYPFGIKNMLKTANLKQVGSIHNGIDDCVNIITIMNHLAKKGCVFKATNKLIDV